MPSRPKIAFVTPGAFPLPSPNSGSVERVVEKFVPLLVPTIEARIYGRLGASLRRKGMLGGAVCVRYPAGDKSRYVLKVGRSLKQYNPAVTQVENRPGLLLKLKKIRPGSRLWLHLHSVTFISRKAIRPATLKRSFRAAERIIVNSEFLRDTVASQAPEIAHKLRVVYPGVDTGRFISQYSGQGKARRDQLREARGWKGRNVILFMGRLRRIKGVHHLLSIMPELIAQHPNVLLVIVGGAFYGSRRETPYVRELHRMGNRMRKHVQFVPYVPHSKVQDWFLGADVAAVPSDRREAFGLVNVEAMACGLPVVATRAGGMKEIIVDGVTGYLVDPEHLREELKNRLLTLLKDDALRNSMGQQSRARVEKHFTWRHSADRWLELLRESGEQL
ncbi:glycosyltransferase family 4 protein [Paenibacillus humicola]|uniref:glycosyltransferase family 4 protein n=1 Tax=Paenibacillus humicola TaxID=3110540 RepID=UPI00237A0E22|nr:glycosyltransferase family 4 protein [Paenibacillus humicola]